MEGVRGGDPGLAACFLVALAALALAVGARGVQPWPESEPAATGASTAYGDIPLRFVPNVGQSTKPIRFSAEAAGVSFGFTEDRLVIASAKGDRGHVLHLRFVGANADPQLLPVGRASGSVNYLTVSERHTNIPTYERLVYRNLWPGIDMLLRGAGGTLKYEFRVSAGANPADIRLAYAGADSLSLGEGGALQVGTPMGILTDSRPRSFQLIGGRRKAVASSYALSGTAYGFAVAKYDHARPLVIDPGLAYSTYLGGSTIEDAVAVAVDDQGAAYVTGGTLSNNFPTSPGAFRPYASGGGDAFVTKLSPDGSEILYSTYLGGNASDTAWDIAIDGEGSAYITGVAAKDSRDFPTTPGAYDQTANGESEAFLSKLSPTGADLVYSTFLGGSRSDVGIGVAVSTEGVASVTGYTESTDFPTTAGAVDATPASPDAFVSRLDSTGSDLVYSTYLGGSSGEVPAAIALDTDGAVHVTGQTYSTDYPTTPGAYDTSANGDVDAFVTKLDPDGSTLGFSTYLGGADRDIGHAIAFTSEGVYVAGETWSANFPATAGAYDTSRNDRPGGGFFVDAFVTKLSTGGSSLGYSTFLGGLGYDRATGLALDSRGSAYLSGQTFSSDFPTTADAFDRRFDGLDDAFVSRLDAAGSELVSSTYLGGSGHDGQSEGPDIAVGPGHTGFVVNATNSSDFPTTPGAFDTSANDNFRDGYVAKLTFNRPPDCTRVVPVPRRLWPPNGKLRPVRLVGATDPDGDAVTVNVTGVTQDEPVSSGGHGKSSPDAVISLPNQVLLRAERSSSGDGRVYRVSFTGSDGAGETCTGTLTAGVPRNNGNRPVPVDSAPPSYDSLG